MTTKSLEWCLDPDGIFSVGVPGDLCLMVSPKKEGDIHGEYQYEIFTFDPDPIGVLLVESGDGYADADQAMIAAEGVYFHSDETD